MGYAAILALIMVLVLPNLFVEPESIDPHSFVEPELMIVRNSFAELETEVVKSRA